MTTFLKVFLAVVLAMVAIKLFPILLALIVALAAAIGIAALIGFSALAGIFCAVLAMAAVLSPIWVPVLVLVGLVSLFKKSGSSVA